LDPHPTILHPTDFSHESGRAFAHALAIAVVRRGRLVLLHAGLNGRGGGGAGSVRQTLARWGYLEDSAPRRAVYDELKVRVEKVESSDRDPVRATLGYVERKPADLLVLATGGPRRLPRFLRRSVAETLARRTGIRTLFVPAQARGFIDPADGRSSLRRILVPYDDDPGPAAALAAAAEARRLATVARLEVTAFHVGDDPPPIAPPSRPGVVFETECVPGDDLVAAILESAHRRQSDLIVMPTHRRTGRAARRSSNTERVVREAPCPVLAVTMRPR